MPVRKPLKNIILALQKKPIRDKMTTTVPSNKVSIYIASAINGSYLTVTTYSNNCSVE